MVGALGKMVSAQAVKGLVTKISLMGSQPCLCDRTEIKASGTKSFVVNSNVYCPTLLPRGINRVYDSTRKGQLEALYLKVFWTLPHEFLLLADLNL